jgi:hypothetical protein
MVPQVSIGVTDCDRKRQHRAKLSQLVRRIVGVRAECRG